VKITRLLANKRINLEAEDFGKRRDENNEVFWVWSYF